MEPDRKKPAAVSHRRAAFVAPARVAAAVLCAGAALAAERPDEADYLFRVSLPANAIDVFLPVREIGTREEAAAYLDWARRTHAGGKGEVRAVWDDEPVGVSYPGNSNLRTNPLAFVRDGDSAVDPSGLNAFMVTNVNAATGAFRLVLAAAPLAAGEADPRVCLTNAFVLPRGELFARWNREAATNAAGVRAEIAALRDSGLFRLSVGRGKAWEAAVDAYVRTNRNLRPKVRFENRSGVPVLLSVDGGAAARIPAGEPFDFVPAAEDGRTVFPWRARRADGPESATDADYKWEEDKVAWSASATEDATKVFFDPPGTLKADPYFDLPRDALPDGLDAGETKAFARYAGAKAPEEVRLERSGGTLRLMARPHRKLESLRIAGPAGWKDGVLQPKGSAELAYGDTGALVLKTPMQPPPKPWPTVVFRNRFEDPVVLEIGDAASAHVTTNVYSGASVRIDFDRLLSGVGGNVTVLLCIARAERAKAPWERTLDLRRGGAEETLDISMEFASTAAPKASVEPVANAKAPASPANYPWPSGENVKKLVNYLRVFGFRVVMGEKTFSGDSVENAKSILSSWQAFWGPPSSLHEKTFRAVVAHIAVCRDGCDKCMKDRAKTVLSNGDLLPKEEAFLALGEWEVESQRRFCRTCAEELRWKYDWSNFEDDRLGWIGFVRTQVDRPGAKATENLKAFWSGENDDGKAFADLYRSIELGVSGGRFSRILRRPTFDERRRELFRQVMLSGPEPQSPALVNGWIQKLDESIGGAK